MNRDRYRYGRAEGTDDGRVFFNGRELSLEELAAMIEDKLETMPPEQRASFALALREAMSARTRDELLDVVSRYSEHNVE